MRVLQVLLYVDPGTGSYIAQLIIASLLGMLYAFRGWIRNLFTRKKTPDNE
jgi:hypothetical protein